MSIERLHDGAWLIADIINGYRVARRYYGYTKREAIRLFKKENH
jgi:hypothetical protein